MEDLILILILYILFNIMTPVVVFIFDESRDESSFNLLPWDIYKITKMN